jgi:hypothetical protein
VSSAAPEAPGRAAKTVDAAPSAGAPENGAQQQGTCTQTDGGFVRNHPVAKELLETPGALLTRTHLRELGLERRAIDAVFRKLPVVSLPGYSRPMIHVEHYRELIRENTYRDDRVRPSHA